MLRLLKLWLPVVLWAAVILSAANDQFSTAHTQGWLTRLFGDLPPIANHVFRKGGQVCRAYEERIVLSPQDQRTFAAVACWSGSGWSVSPRPADTPGQS